MDNKNVNHQIKANKVMVIDGNGNRLGVLPKHIAISQAQNQGYDLVEVSSKSNPPVCKIMDYGKYQFEQRKQDKKNKAKNKVHLKEIRMKTRIADHDLTTKCRRCLEFLSKGNIVKVSIQINRRRHNDDMYAQSLMDRITEVVSEIGITSSKPKLNGRFLDITYSPSN